MSAQKAKAQRQKQSHLLFPADFESPEHHDRKKDTEDVNNDRQYCFQLSYDLEIDQCKVHTARRLIDLSSHN